MNNQAEYDVIIVGGGLAGLSLSILMARKQYKVLVLEKDSYPRHRVCGEYISNESLAFLTDLGLQLNSLDLPQIDTLQVTDTFGNEVIANLPQGGFGISRFLLDAELAKLAINTGVELLTKTRVDDIVYNEDLFTVTSKNNTYTARLVAGTWGKKSNLDVKWGRSFVMDKNKSLTNFMSIKYHIKYNWPVNRIGLHNFNDGYCGISKIEDGKCCLCYLTTAQNLQENGNDIKQLERNVLMQNPILNNIFTNAEFLFDAPATISQISFEKKEQVLNHILMLGDTGGLISPLSGNGMSMAFHASKIGAGLMSQYLEGNINRLIMEQTYTQQWKQQFNRRISTGRFVQSKFGKMQTTAFFLKTMKLLPFLRRIVINSAIGKEF